MFVVVAYLCFDFVYVASVFVYVGCVCVVWLRVASRVSLGFAS